ncbi:cbb3-type cytochrome c oxidase N-terminal domain-containing protein [Paraflavisolibacter sp. H34]|uniref:cbb3-type cytochrome c oxidase N-terminal domain-containing protein n=1 Tax=Huijunlia imazamoxiresistens TaxID=3127457 RepID=UPI00301624EC
MRKSTTYKFLFSGLLLVLLQSAARAQEAAAGAGDAGAAEAAAAAGGWFHWGMATLFLFVLFFLASVLLRFNNLGKEGADEDVSLQQWWARLNRKVFTRAVPVEDEDGIILDHEYDGIRELDNALPPWWKWGFYLSLVVAVIYVFRFHVLKTGPDPEQEYRTEMSLAAAQLEEYRKTSNDMVDEKTVTLSDAAGIEAGKKIYSQSCFPCHGGKGEGGVGPNLTDDYWLHGGSLGDVFKTIKYGWPDKGMQAWEKTFSPSQIKDLASYIKSLRGTNPPNAKAAQGDLYAEAATAGAPAK